MSTTSQSLEEVVRYSTKYKSDNIGLLSILLLGIIVLIGAIVLLIILQLASHPKPLTFKLNENLQIIDPPPLNTEGISKPALFNWVNNFILDAFSFNYSNQDKQPFKLSQYLSESAMDNYKKLLAEDSDFSTIADNKYVVSVSMVSTPEVGDGKEYQGRYAWQIKVPLEINFSNAISKGTQRADMYLVVLRVPDEQSPLGVIIAAFDLQVSYRQSPQLIKSGF